MLTGSVEFDPHIIKHQWTNWNDWWGENSLFSAESQTVFGCWFPVYEIR